MSDFFNIGADPLSYSGLKVNPPVVPANRDPNSTDINYSPGQQWTNTVAGTNWFLGRVSGGTATWNLAGAGGTGAVVSITGNSGGAEVPDGGGNFNILGTANQLSVAGTANTETISLSSTLVAPGSITTTTSLSVGTTLTSAGATTLATTGASVNTFGNTTGATSVTISVGTGNFVLNGVAGSTYTIGAATTTGTISIGGTAQTGTMTIAGGSGAQTINIANSTGGKTVNIAAGAGANALTIGSTNTTSATTINAGSGGIHTVSAGLVNIDTATDTQASPTATSVLNVNAGAATFTGFTTAAGSTQNFTITNSLVTTSSNILCTVCNEGANDAQMQIMRITRAAGSFVVLTKNQGAAALNGNVIVTFWVLDN